jgi:hypothetical protein
MLQRWLTRISAAAALLFGSEVVLWNDPASRTVLDWVLLVFGYVAVSAVVLDLGVRYRVRDIFGLLVLAGVYGLLNGALLNPQTALLEVPRTLVTRVLGGHTLLGLGVLGLLLTLNRTHSHPRWIAVGVIGLLWGVWVRWLPTLADTVTTDVPLLVMLVYGLAGVMVFTMLVPRVNTPAQRLTIVEWGIVGAIQALLFVRNTLPTVDAFALIVVGVLAAFCVLLLWFQKRDRGAMLFDSVIGSTWMVVLTLGGVFLATGVVGYLLPLGSVPELLTPYVALFTAFGVVWLPSVSLVLGVRAYRKLTRQMQL